LESKSIELIDNSNLADKKERLGLVPIFHKMTLENSLNPSQSSKEQTKELTAEEKKTLKNRKKKEKKMLKKHDKEKIEIHHHDHVVSNEQQDGNNQNADHYLVDISDLTLNDETFESFKKLIIDNYEHSTDKINGGIGFLDFSFSARTTGLKNKKYDLKEGVIIGFDDKRLYFSPSDDSGLNEDGTAFLVKIKPENIVLNESLFLTNIVNYL